MIQIGVTKLLWMVMVINGDIAGVFLDEPMPAYMTTQECEASATMHSFSPEALRRKVKFRCVWEYGRPVKTGRYWRPME